MELNKKKEFIKHLLFILLILSVCFYLFFQVPVVKDFSLIRWIFCLIRSFYGYYFSFYVTITSVIDALISAINALYGGGWLIITITNISKILINLLIILFKNIFLLIPLSIYIAYVIVAFKSKTSKIISIIISLLTAIVGFLISLDGISSIILESIYTSLIRLLIQKNVPTLIRLAILSLNVAVLNIIKIILYSLLSINLLINTIFFIKESNLNRVLKVFIGIFLVIAIIICSIIFVTLDLNILTYNFANVFEIPQKVFMANVFNFIINILGDATYLVLEILNLIQMAIPSETMIFIVLMILLVICIIKSITLIFKKSKALKILGIVALVLTILAIIGFIIIQLGNSVFSIILWIIISIIRNNLKIIW